MPKHQLFARESTFPSWYVNAQEEFQSSHEPRLTLANATTVQVDAASDYQVGLTVNGAMRYITAPVTRAAGGSAGSYDVFVTSKNNQIVNTPQPYTDQTDYSFQLAIVAAGSTPTIVAGSVERFEKIGTLTWDGSAITSLVQTLERVAPTQLPVGLFSNTTTATITRAPNGSLSVTVPDGSIDGAKIAGSLKPSVSAAAGTEALRAIGSGAGQVVAGADARLTDQRTPLDGSVTAAKVDGSLKPSGTAGAAAEALRALGTTPGTAAAGNDPRLSDARTPNGAAGGDLTGNYPSPTIGAGSVNAAKVAASLKPSGTAGATDEALRAIGTGPGQVAAGNDTRFGRDLPRRTTTDNTSLVLADANSAVDVDATALKTLTVPAQGTIAWSGTPTVQVTALGVGAVQVVADTGVTIETANGDGKMKTAARYQPIELQRLSVNRWMLVGARA